jgi:hypothetical protein
MEWRRIHSAPGRMRSKVSLLLLHDVQEVQVRRSRRMVTKEDDGGVGKVHKMDEDVRVLI